MHRLLNIIKNNKFSLIASLPANDYRLAQAAWDNGADAVKVHINVEHRASGTSFGSYAKERERLEKILEVSRGPVGIVAGGGPEPAERDIGKAVGAGFDFISIYAHHAALGLLEPGVTRMFAADYSYSMDEIRRLERYADILEASVIAPDNYGDRLNLRDLVKYGRLRDAVSIPVVIPTQKNIIPAEVQLLCEAGASAIMIGAIVAGKTADSYGRATAVFRKAIDAIR